MMYLYSIADIFMTFPPWIRLKLLQKLHFAMAHMQNESLNLFGEYISTDTKNAM
jgi:hypothetical protein